ncbi:hypothetical protein [Anaerosporobacter sp.]
MPSQPNEQNVTDMINAIFKDEMQSFDAAFDIVKNEILPSISLAIESYSRAVQEYKNGQSQRESRIDAINKNADKITSIYFSPACKAIQDKINKYYQFVNDEFKQLQTALNTANANAQNMIAFQTIWLMYENQLQECISGTSEQGQQGESTT